MATHGEPAPDPPPGQDEFDLPPELWEQIFALSCGQTLLTARLVCHRWRAIADRKRALWTNMWHRFPYGVQLDEQFARDRWTPAPSVRLNGSKILLVESSWWVPLGERLTDINLLCCTVTLETLLGMLRRTPNLERLSLYMVLLDCEEEPVGDFQLLKMKEFRVRADSTFGVFGEVFPQLSSLILEVGCTGQERCCRLIKLVQGTLKRLRFRATKYLALNMSLMNRLQLQHLDMFGSYEVAALFLCHVQPSIEELLMAKVEAQNSMLCHIGKKLPRLRQLKTSLAEVETILTPSFLAMMPHLRKLSLTASLNKQQINFTQYKCSHLNELYLSCLQPVENSLQAFLSGAKTLHKLELFNCALDSWSNVLTMLADLPSLRHLKLGYLRLPDVITSVPPNLRTNLEHLELYGRTSMTSAMIVQLCSLSPQIKVLHLCQPPSVDDSTLQTLWSLLPLLTRLVHCKSPPGSCRLFELC